MTPTAPLSASACLNTLGAWVLVRDVRTVYDEWNPVAQIDAAGQVVQRHLWGTDLGGSMQGAGGVGGLLGTWDNGATTRDGGEPGDGVARVWVCAYDGNGNVSAAIAATVAGGASGGSGAGTVRVARYDYDAFGKTLATWGDGTVAEANRYRFSTKPEDGTGLLYYGYRYFDTRMGRWVSRDPIEERGGVNSYGMIRNNAFTAFDVLGLFVPHSTPTLPLAPPANLPFGAVPPIHPPLGGNPPQTGTVEVPYGQPQYYESIAEMLPANANAPKLLKQKNKKRILRRLSSICPCINKTTINYIGLPGVTRKARGVAGIVAKGDRVIGTHAGRASPPGFWEAHRYHSGTVDRGHLLGYQFGGKGQLRNLVTMFSYINQRTYKNFESQVRIRVKLILTTI